jgi:drug/metabolite transporter (DMT)-like permease
MSRKGIVLFASMCVIWGIPYLMIRVAVRELTPATLVFWRTAIAALLLMPLALLRGHIRPLLAHWRAFVAYTLIEVAIPWLFLARAETKISSSLAGLLIAAVPLVGAAIVTVTGDHEWKGGRRLAGLAVGMVGVAAIVGVDVHSTGVVPILEMAVVVVCYAVGPLILSRWLSTAPALGVVAASLALTALIYVPVAIVQWPSSTPSRHVVESVIGLALICTALAFLLFFALIAEVGPVRATVITYVNPAVAAVVGVAVLGEHLTVGMILGFLLVLAGAFLATGGSARATTRVAATLER